MSQTVCPSVRTRPAQVLLVGREETETGRGTGQPSRQPGRKGAKRSRMMMMMMILVVIMRQRRTVMKDMKAIMVMRMTAVLATLMIKIHAVDC